MDDPISSLRLTTVTLFRAGFSVTDALVKRPYRKTRTYRNVTPATCGRIRRLYDTDQAEIVRVPDSDQQAYLLFYWKKRLLHQPASPETQDINENGDPKQE